jgi:hypothetical protein
MNIYLAREFLREIPGPRGFRLDQRHAWQLERDGTRAKIACIVANRETTATAFDAESSDYHY